MPYKANTQSRNPVRSACPDLYSIPVRFTSAGVSSPTVVEPGETLLTVARTGAGEYTCTFRGTVKPRRIMEGSGYVEADEPRLHVRYTGYNNVTGVATFKLYTEDGITGVPFAADTTGLTVVLTFWCTDRQRNDL
jgi:hypothetical protein